MKKFAIVLSVMGVLASGSAKADGFVCGTTDGSLKIKVYNRTQAATGTRVAAVMILSNPAIQAGNKTIATFTNTEGSLSNQGASYTAHVDQHLANGGRGGEYIAGTRLAYVRTVDLDLNFSYARPVRDGYLVPGMLTVETLNGKLIRKQVGCARYLKN